MMMTTIEYKNGTDFRYKDAAPSINAESKTVTICDKNNGVIDELELKDIASITWEANHR